MSVGRDCRSLRSRLLEVAAGNGDPEVEQHVKHCHDCSRLLEQYATLHLASALPRFDAPDEVVRRAKALFQPKRRVAALVRSSLAGAGARRAEADAFQCLFEAQGDSIRVGYVRRGTKWVVQGSAAPRFSHVQRGRRKIAIESGKFRFESKSLDQCGFTLVAPGEELDVPPPEVGR